MLSQKGLGSLESIMQYYVLELCAIQKSQANLRSQSARVMQWEVVNAPKQPGKFECGYYVMRFMKEIIENPNILSKKFNGKERYTQEEIDEVRLE
ncbi:hypothetical protein Q3G72_022843 [Acer saccharum]|nr:hypothetical protein Q3G72_022843 [Acer saccharum]